MEWKAAAVGLVILCGCTTPPSHPPGPEALSGALQMGKAGGPTRLTMINHLAWPYRLEQIAVTLDGQLVYAKHLPTQAGSWVAGEFRDLSVGDHTVSVRALVIYASGTLGQECSIVVKASHTFALGDREAGVGVDLHTQGVTQDFVDRVRVGFGELGTLPGLTGHAAVPERPVALPINASACAGITGVDQAICKAREGVDQARRTKDIVVLMCRSEKLTELVTLRQQLPGASETKAAVVMDRVKRISDDLDACGTSGTADDWWPVEQPACRGVEPIHPSEAWNW